MGVLLLLLMMMVVMMMMMIETVLIYQSTLRFHYVNISKNAYPVGTIRKTHKFVSIHEFDHHLTFLKRIDSFQIFYFENNDR